MTGNQQEDLLIGGVTAFDNNDNAVDRLTGSQGTDWFWANTAADGGAVLDIISDLVAGEQSSDIDSNIL